MTETVFLGAGAQAQLMISSFRAIICSGAGITGICAGVILPFDIVSAMIDPRINLNSRVDDHRQAVDSTEPSDQHASQTNGGAVKSRPDKPVAYGCWCALWRLAVIHWRMIRRQKKPSTLVHRGWQISRRDIVPIA